MSDKKKPVKLPEETIEWRSAILKSDNGKKEKNRYHYLVSICTIL
jgi:hypothetical protein